MSAYALVLNEARCIQCHACEIHCQTWNGLPPDLALGRLQARAPHRIPQQDTGQQRPVRLRSLFLACQHCDDPWCVRVCPTMAMRRRSRDGIVYVETGLCVGCRACAMACPWRIPQWNHQQEVTIKCDMCRSRLDAALVPACVAGCTAKALSLVSDTAILDRLRQEREAALHAAAAREELW